MIFSVIFIPLICNGTVKEKICFLGETNSVPQALGNMVAKHVDYLIHSTLQPMPYYSKTYDTEHKYREYLVAVVYKCKLSKIVYFKLCN